MCDRYSFSGSAGMLSSCFGIEDVDSEPRENFNISSSQFAPAILCEDGRIQLRHLHWGLIPSYASESDVGDFMINAREDTLSLMPCFKHAFKARRCLIPANGYFDWANEDGHRQPYFITSKSGELLGFAGLWEKWVDASGNNGIESFTIITTDASPEITHLNDRMPVILAKEAYRDWLDPDFQDLGGLAQILKTGKERDIKYYKVSGDVSNPLNNSPELIRPVDANPTSSTNSVTYGAIDNSGSANPKRESAPRSHRKFMSLLSALVG